MDALYFRVSSDRQTTENQFDELLDVAGKGGTERDWERIRADLRSCILAEMRTTRRGAIRTLYRVDLRLPSVWLKSASMLNRASPVPWAGAVRCSTA